GGSSGGASRFGGGAGSPASTSTPVRPSSPSSPLSSASAGAKQSPLGGAKAGAAQPAKADAGKGGAPAASLGARFSAFTQSLPLIGKRDGKAAAKKQRASKVPEVKKSEGMSLDTKLDILGVVLVFSSMIIFFSALSPSQGEVTGQINRVVGEWLGWGALAFPVTLLASGVWLILRHFGDKAPEIDPLRIIGVTMLYLGLLVIFQFVESLNYTGDRAVYSLIDLENQVHVSYGAYRAGGGLIGGELYLFLVSNITEVGAFFTVLGWMFVGFMLFADLSASEVAIVIISIWRSFSDSVKRQRQRRASRIAELQAQRAAAAATAALAAPQQPQIAVSRPAPSELPAVATSGALPAPAVPTPVAIPAPPVPQTEERSIPMRLGGRSEILKVDGSGRPAAPAAGLSTAPQPETLPAAAEKKDEAEASGLGSRLRGALPFGGKSAAEPTAEKPAAPAADKPAAASSLAGRLFGNKSAEPAAEKPLPAAATPTPAANKPAAASSLAGRLFGNKGAADKPETPAATPTSAPAPSRTVPISPTAAAGQPPSSPAPSAATPSTAPAAQASTEMPAARLGDLLRSGPAPTFDKPAAPSTPSTSPAATPPPSPFSRPAAPPSSTVPLSRPVVDDEEDMDEDDESVLDMSPARPKGMGPVPRPPSAFGTGGLPGTKPTESEAPKPAGGIAERMDRLNALRSGATAPVPPMPRPGVDDDEEDKPAAPAAKVEPAVTPKPTDEAAKPAAEASAAAQQGGLGTRIRPFNFGEQGDKPAATVSASVVSGAPATPPKEGEEKKPPVFTPAGTPAVTAAPKISLPIGHPDTPPAPTTAAPAPTFAGAQQIKRPKREWKLPDYRTLLATGSDQDFDRAFLTQRARVIEDTLQSFGAPGKVVEINTGPVITQFGVEPDYLMSRSGKKNRIKVSAIAALDKDLQLALGAKSIRIEAPVPGKGFVGVEVPNDEAALVSLRDVMDSDEFKKIDSPLTIALGQSVDGTPVAADLSSMPHLLIAGTTGSGKSVCVNAIISSLVLLNSPERVKFIMVDPKRVELTGYNGIPHLVAPVVVELERIVGVLKWVTREMDERYKKFSAAGARNIEDYNKHLPADAEIMPYIVVIIDELADLMMLAPDETERVITRIAALARATGIHLVIATQRPSVDVVTGLIKANFPARIAFAVAGSVDSRVILDQPGAERLLGRGDMLYMSGDSPAPVRLQGVYVSDVEINNIVRYWKQQSDESGGMPVPQLILDKSIASDSSSGLRMGGTTQQPPKPVVQQQAFWDRSGGNSARDEDEDGYDDEVEDADGDGEDDMYDEAVELIRKLNKASVSLLQRRLRIGYTRAARLIDLMEERGVVGPAESGSKPRDVLPAKD
ncbi:MAG: DNA translocase FtsK, partial [Anaerolineae bacterium]